MSGCWTIRRVSDARELVRASHLFDDAVTEDAATDALAREHQVFFVAHAADDSPIGFVSGVEMRHPDKHAEMFINELGVDERWRRRGVATDLIHALETEARARGCRALWTGTEQANTAALRLYRRLGAAIDPVAVFVEWELF